MQKENLYAVIMAGGVGARFWPVSTEEKPKQFHDMLGTGYSLLQHTYKRLLKNIPSTNIFISTNKKYSKTVLAQLPELSDNQLILEPAMRNTAPAILYAVSKIHDLNPNAVMLIAPSDHWIEKENLFHKKLNQAFETASKKEFLMTLGVQPTYANTGYGYIKYIPNDETVKKVAAFTEKPDPDKAAEFFASKKYLWNAGIFVWSTESILTAYKTYLPDMYELFSKGKSFWNSSNEAKFIIDNYPKAQNISIDFGIMEMAENVYVIPIDVGWSDLGTWGALYNKLSKNKSENIILHGSGFLENTTGNIIHTQKGKKVLIKGLQNFIIVETKDELMIIPKSDEQAIKELSKKLNHSHDGKAN